MEANPGAAVNTNRRKQRTAREGAGCGTAPKRPPWGKEGAHAAGGPGLPQSLLPDAALSSFQNLPPLKLLVPSCRSYQFLGTWVPSGQVLVSSLPVTSVLAKLGAAQAQVGRWVWLMGTARPGALESPDLHTGSGPPLQQHQTPTPAGFLPPCGRAPLPDVTCRTRLPHLVTWSFMDGTVPLSYLCRWPVCHPSRPRLPNEFLSQQIPCSRCPWGRAHCRPPASPSYPPIR